MAWSKKTVITLVVLLLVAVVTALLLRQWLNSVVMEDLQHPNVQAFLRTLRFAEGTSGPDGYNTVYGGGKITNLTDHPYYTGEWKGKTLPDSYCIAAGYSPGCKSTAAGAYQFTRPTWSRLKIMLNLPDFSPNSQDMAAVQLLREKKALDKIKAGDFAGAVAAVAKVWASLPGAPYGQPTKTLAQLQSVYESNGGNLT